MTHLRVERYLSVWSEFGEMFRPRGQHDVVCFTVNDQKWGVEFAKNLVMCHVSREHCGSGVWWNQ